jgi:predicted nucleotide-binding protein
MDLLRRVVFDDRFGPYIGDFPEDAGIEWLRTKQVKTVFQHWKNQLADRRDVFLGYCSTSTTTAKKLKAFLKTELQLKVLDWRTDFSPGLTVLEQIQDAASRCTAGIFLFTQDDKLTGESGSTTKAVPRDNVVFEAGYLPASRTDTTF